jgi:hypothetical protein
MPTVADKAVVVGPTANKAHRAFEAVIAPLLIVAVVPPATPGSYATGANAKATMNAVAGYAKTN